MGVTNNADNRQTRELQLGTSQTLGFFVYDIFLFLACIGIAFYYSWQLTLVMLSTGIPSALALWYINRFLDPAIEGQKRELAEAAKHVTAATTAIELVKVYNAADHESFRFMSAIRRSAKYYRRQVLCNCSQMGYIKLWMLMLFVISFFVAVVLVDRGVLTAGNALTTFYAALIAFQSIETLGPQWLILFKGMAAGQILEALVSETDKDQNMNQYAAPYRPQNCRGSIDMRNISFAYPSNPNKTVVSPSNFHFAAGQLTFVIGRSGSGKSTLGNLLLRFYEPRTGSVLIDGLPAQRLDLNWLRSNVTLIQQSSILFNDTFLRNVALGAQDPDNVSTKEIQDACSFALLQSTIAGMPDGMNTIIGPNGYALSGGQRQRLMLARAKLRDPPVLILDEITSGLDPVGRALIMDAIRIWRKGKTTIIITHEVGHIEDEEYTYVMEDGRIVQEGYRKDLSETDGLFASLLASADDAQSSTASYSSESDIESESDVFDNNYGEGVRYVNLIHSLVNPPMYRQTSFLPGTIRGADHIYSGAESNHQSPSLGNRPSRYGNNSSAPRDPLSPRRINRDDIVSMHLVTQAGLDVKNHRIPNSRSVMTEKAVNASQNTLDSLDLFFLEKLAKPKDRKKSPRGQLPSLKVVLKTVWPTLDSRGKADLILGLLLCVVVAGCNPGFSFVFAQLLSAFWLPDNRLSSGSQAAGILAIIAAVDALATFSCYYLMERVAQKWINNLRSEAIRRILSQPKAWFDKPNHSPSRITQCLDRNAEEMRKLVGMFMPIIVIVSFMILTAIIWALAVRWDLTLVTLAGIPAAFATARANSLVSDKWEGFCDEAAKATGTIFTETFANIKVVRALTLERYFTNKHELSTKAAYRLGVKRATWVGAFYGLSHSIAYFLTALVFFYSAKILSEGKTTPTDIVRVINLVLFSLGTAVSLLANVPQIAAAKATATQMLYYANLSHDSSHESQGTKFFSFGGGGGSSGGSSAGSSPLPVRMNNVRFAYPSAPAKQVLRNVNLQIDPGTSIAIAGFSGCGKSTIAALLLRLYDPMDPDAYRTVASPAPTMTPSSPRSLPGYPFDVYQDSYELEVKRPRNNPFFPPDHFIASPTATTFSSRHPLTYGPACTPASEIQIRSLRRHIAYVPQHPFLFPTTVRENILYGLPEGGCSSFESSNLNQHQLLLRSQANIERAATLAGIHDFIVSLPDGYDTRVGEGGMSVSGGQAQRLSIARALVRWPKLLIMDEPTSALDAEGAEGVRNVVKALVTHSHDAQANMAVVVITHSKEMMRITDRVVMVEEGSVVETGSYDELASRGGAFAQLVGKGAWYSGKSGKSNRSNLTTPTATMYFESPLASPRFDHRRQVVSWGVGSSASVHQKKKKRRTSSKGKDSMMAVSRASSSWYEDDTDREIEGDDPPPLPTDHFAEIQRSAQGRFVDSETLRQLESQPRPTTVDIEEMFSSVRYSKVI